MGHCVLVVSRAAPFRRDRKTWATEETHELLCECPGQQNLEEETRITHRKIFTAFEMLCNQDLSQVHLQVVTVI
jgi:hypothetical protein